MEAFYDSPAPEGDEEAIRKLYERYNGAVCRFTLHRLRQKGCNWIADHSEGIISSVWLLIIEHIDQLKDSEKIEPWINTIVLNKVLDHVSGPKGCISNQQKRVTMEAAEEARIEHADKVYQDRLLADRIRTAADARSSKFAEVMRLYIEEEYTMDEIAKTFGDSPAKLRSMYYRNLSHLRDIFRDASDDDEDNDEDNDEDDDTVEH